MKLAIGIDIGGTNIKTGIVTLEGKILDFTTVPTPKTSAKDIVDTIANIVSIKEKHFQASLLMGVGVPGVCDAASREVIITPNLVSKNFSLRQELEKATGKRIAMDNDANMAAVGEWWQGAGRNFKHLLLLTLGTGVGAGIIIEDTLFRGSTGWAGEIGNTIVFPGGENCNCGKKGCLEAYASASAIAKRYSALIQEDVKTEAVFEQARKGDFIAEKIIDEAIDALAIGIYNYSLIFNPQAIILGGGMIKAGEQLLRPLQEKVFDMLGIYPGHSEIVITEAEMENKAGVLGAAKSVFDMYTAL